MATRANPVANAHVMWQAPTEIGYATSVTLLISIGIE